MWYTENMSDIIQPPDFQAIIANELIIRLSTYVMEKHGEQIHEESSKLATMASISLEAIDEDMFSEAVERILGSTEIPSDLDI